MAEKFEAGRLLIINADLSMEPQQSPAGCPVLASGGVSGRVYEALAMGVGVTNSHAEIIARTLRHLRVMSWSHAIIGQ